MCIWTVGWIKQLIESPYLRIQCLEFQPSLPRSIDYPFSFDAAFPRRSGQIMYTPIEGYSIPAQGVSTEDGFPSRVISKTVYPSRVVHDGSNRTDPRIVPIAGIIPAGGAVSQHGYVEPGERFEQQPCSSPSPHFPLFLSISFPLSLPLSFFPSLSPPRPCLSRCPPHRRAISIICQEGSRQSLLALTDIQQSQTRGGRGGSKRLQRRGLAQRQTACRGRGTFPRFRLSRLLR
jgi:hypothetical protein